MLTTANMAIYLSEDEVNVSCSQVLGHQFAVLAQLDEVLALHLNCFLQDNTIRPHCKSLVWVLYMLVPVILQPP